MDRETFRCDRRLRSSGYHLATWSLAAFVLQLQLSRAAEAGGSGLVPDRASLVAMAVVVVAASMVTSFINERRVAKITGPAGVSAYDGAGAMWRVVLGVLVLVTGVLLSQSRGWQVFDVWAFGVGGAYILWGTRANFPWFSRIGLLMVVAGLFDVLMLSLGEPVTALRLLVLGVLLPAAALATNRRYLWPTS
jgi:hypothetical protein